MSWDGWFTLALVGFSTLVLILTRISADIVFTGALTLLLVSGVLTAEEALAGFSNPGLITVAALFVVVAGLVDTGGVQLLTRRLLGRPKSLSGAQLRLILPVAVMSAFLNNTPVVAMLVPVVQEWGRHHRLALSKLMIPLSYAAILGGTCTLIGTSTNLIVNGLLLTQAPGRGLGFFDIAWAGLPCAVVGLSYVLLCSRWLLPTRQAPIAEHRDPRSYAVEMLVDVHSPLPGQSIEEAGLRHLPGVFLAEIERDGDLLAPVAPSQRLRGGDRLVFVGSVGSVADLVKIRGLLPAQVQSFNIDAPRNERCLVEAVVSDRSPMLSGSVRERGFRKRYDAVIIAVARNGERVPGRIGDIRLQAGDTLLLETRESFVTQQSQSRDFLLVSAIRDSTPPRHERAGIALLILAAMVVVTTLGLLSMLEAALVAAGLMILSRCTRGASARRSVDWSILVVIGASLGLGAALQKTGVANGLAGDWLTLAGDDPWLALLAVYSGTVVLSAFITNNAAAVILFPIAVATAEGLGVDSMPFIIAIMLGASASFATPIGYQTNLMVYGPGGYRYGDYLRIGLPLNLLLALVSVWIIPRIWPF